MNTFLPIRYRDFWDLPRIFLVDYLDETYLFDCEFDEQTEDYSQEYKVYLMPLISEKDLDKSWKDLYTSSIKLISKVSIYNVEFDETKRKFVNRSVLERILIK
jgi:hypothetical protein